MKPAKAVYPVVDRWDDEYPAGPRLGVFHPGRQEIVISFAHKLVLLLAIVAVVAGLWALTSQPVARGTGAGDATLGSPIVPSPGIAVDPAGND